VTAATPALTRAGIEFRLRVGEVLSRRRVRDPLAFLFFLAFTALWFHRLMFNMNDAVLYGPNDASYGIRQYWGAAYFHKTPFTEVVDPLNGAPEGLPIAAAVQTANALIPGVIWILHYPFGFTAASNIYLLGGLVLTGFSFYLLLDRLGFHPFGALVAGYALTFNPWMLERAGAGHSGFMQAWIFPLLVGVMLYAHRKRTLLAAVFVGLTMALSFYNNSYYGLMAGLVFVVFWGYDLAIQKSWGERLWSFTMADIALVSAIVAFSPALYVWLKNVRAVGAGVSNPVQDVQNLGATTQAYFLPSFRHPLLSHITRHFYPRAAFVWSENTLYLGWSLIILAAIGVYFVYRRYPETFALPLTRFFLIGMIILAPAAFLTSLQRKTTWLGVTIPMPSYVISDITTFWRVYARFGLLVTFALGALAALTLTVAIRRLRYGWAIALVAFGVLIFEYYDGVLPIYKLKPAAYATWLSHQPRGIVANYPLPTDNPAALHLLARTYYQQMYDKQPNFQMFGGGYGQTREDGIRVLVRYVTAPVTPSVLKAEHVKYILLHDDVYREAGATPPPVPAGFHLVTKLPGDIRVLELNPDVKPANLDQVLEQNAVPIGAAEGLPVPQVTVEGTPGAAPGSGTISGSGIAQLKWNSRLLKRALLIVKAKSEGAPTQLTLRDADGHTYGTWPIGNELTQVSFGPFPVSGTSAQFTFTTSPAAKVAITPLVAQPLADFSVSVRSY
jgi:hypothetical protein